MKIYIYIKVMVSTRVFSDNFQRVIAQKLRKGEISLSSGTHCLDLPVIYISIKYHKDILSADGQCHTIITFFQNGRIKIDDWDVKKLKQTKILKRKNI